jgi:hypothetical protein
MSIVGARLEGLISLEIQEQLEAVKDKWPQATGFYSATKRQYILHFPLSTEVTRDPPVQRVGGATFVFDFVKRGWTDIETSPVPIYCGTAGTTAVGVFCPRDPTGGSRGGIWRWSAATGLKQPVSYQVKTVLGNPLMDKRILRAVAIYTANADDPTPFSLTIESDKTEQTSPSLALAPQSGRETERLSITGRVFTITARHFAALSHVALEFVPLDAVQKEIV